MYCFPENFVVDGVVAVAESVSHSGDGSPFYTAHGIKLNFYDLYKYYKNIVIRSIVGTNGSSDFTRL